MSGAEDQMVKGILADINAIGHVEYLVTRMQAEPWAEFWNGFGLSLWHFDDFGLSSDSADIEIWHVCQAEQLILITDNRNLDAPDSLEATIREHNKADSLPVFTIADMDQLRKNRSYAERVLGSLYEYLLQIDEVRGAGRLYLP